MRSQSCSTTSGLCRAGDGSQGLMHVRQTLYPLRSSPRLLFLFLCSEPRYVVRAGLTWHPQLGPGPQHHGHQLWMLTAPVTLELCFRTESKRNIPAHAQELAAACDRVDTTIGPSHSCECGSWTGIVSCRGVQVPVDPSCLHTPSCVC